MTSESFHIAKRMGWGAYSLNVWSDGKYNGATRTNQNDLQIITDHHNGISYREDDHYDVMANATSIYLNNAGLVKVSDGIIGRNDNADHDIDFFSFSLDVESCAVLSVNEDAVIGASNLDVFAILYDNAGVQIYDSELNWDPGNTKISAYFNVTLDAGTYYLSIEGRGWGEPMNDPPE